MKTSKPNQSRQASAVCCMLLTVLIISCGPGAQPSCIIGDNCNEWIPIGPGGGGTIFVPVISPHDKDVMMALCDMTGTFLTKDGGNSWKTLYFKGTTDTYCFDPADPNIIYVGATQSGLWKSVDGGDNWVNIQPDFQPFTRVSRIAVDPADNSIVYVGTSNGSFHVSYDGGATFEYNIFPAEVLRDGEYHSGYGRSGPGNGAIKDVTNMFYVDPESPRDKRVIYTFNRNLVNGGNITFKSSINRIERTGPGRRDYRITYIAPPIPTNINAIDCIYDAAGSAGRKTTYYFTMSSPSISVPATVADPSAPNQWFPNQFQDPATDMYDGSLWMTNDINDPSSYTLIADNNTKALRNIFREHNRHPEDHLTFSRLKAASNKLFILAVVSHKLGSGFYQYGYLRSTDGGKSWEWLIFKEEDEMVYPGVDRCPPSWLDYHFSYEYPGAAWGIATNKIPPASDDPSGVRIAMVDQGQIYLSDDGGYRWRHGHCKTTTGEDGYVYGATTGIQATSTYDLTFNPFDPKHIVISKTDIGQIVSYDGGISWRPNETGLMPEPYGWRQFNKFKKDNPKYARYWTNTCYKTVFDPDVKNKVWSIWSGQHDMPRRQVKSSLANLPGCIAVSIDAGHNMTIQAGYQVPEAKTGMPELSTVFTDFIIDLNSSPKSRTLYTATFGNGVYKSVDGGVTWKQKVNGIEPLEEIPQDQVDDGMLYRAWRLMMTPDGALYVTMYHSPSTTPGCYVSHDGAETWEKLTMPGGARFVWSMDYDWSDQTYKTLYATTESTRDNPGGVYKSTDGGHRWELIHGNTTPAFNGRGVLVDRFNANTVFASSNNGYLMRSDDAGKTWHELNVKLQWHERIIQNPREPDMLYITTFGLGAWRGPAKNKSVE